MDPIRQMSNLTGVGVKKGMGNPLVAFGAQKAVDPTAEYQRSQDAALGRNGVPGDDLTKEKDALGHGSDKRGEGQGRQPQGQLGFDQAPKPESHTRINPDTGKVEMHPGPMSQGPNFNGKPGAYGDPEGPEDEMISEELSAFAEDLGDQFLDGDPAELAQGLMRRMVDQGILSEMDAQDEDVFNNIFHAIRDAQDEGYGDFDDGEELEQAMPNMNPFKRPQPAQPGAQGLGQQRPQPAQPGPQRPQPTRPWNDGGKGGFGFKNDPWNFQR